MGKSKNRAERRAEKKSGGKKFNSLEAASAAIITPPVEEPAVKITRGIRVQPASKAAPEEKKNTEQAATVAGLSSGTVVSNHNKGGINYTKILTTHPDTKQPITILAYKPIMLLPEGAKVAFTFGKFSNKLTAENIQITAIETEEMKLIKKLRENSTAASLSNLSIKYLTDIIAEYTGGTKVGTVDEYISSLRIIGKVNDEIYILQQ